VAGQGKARRFYDERDRNKEQVMPPRAHFSVVELAGAPPQCRWAATYDEWDFCDPMGLGATPEEAIADLELAMGEDDAAE
jgi:hypothetical protein